MSGVHSYVDANDITGNNEWKYKIEAEPIFSTGRSEYAGQAIGLIVADTQEIALAAAKKVKVSYDNFGPIVLDLEESINDSANVTSGGYAFSYGNADGELAAADIVVSGRFKMGSQYHFYMETIVCISKPADDGFDLELPTQDMATVANVVSKSLNIPSNRYVACIKLWNLVIYFSKISNKFHEFFSINIGVKRLGGAYGGKIECPTLVACATTIAANKVKRPVRLALNLEDTMCLFGKRTPYMFDYQV